MNTANEVVKTLEQSRRENGTSIILKMNGTNLQVSAITETLGNTPGYLAAGNLNALDTDFRVFNVCPYPDSSNPSQASLLPIRDVSSVVWNGIDYTVTQVAQEVFGQLPISLRLFAFRTSEPEENEPGNTQGNTKSTADKNLFNTSTVPTGNTGFFSN